MSPPGIPSSPSDVRVSLASALGSTKKSKAKVKAKEVKKEVRNWFLVWLDWRVAGRALLCPGLLQCEGGKTEVHVLLSVLQAKCWFEKPKIQGRLSGSTCCYHLVFVCLHPPNS